MARRENKPVHKVVMTEGKRNIIRQLRSDQKKMLQRLQWHTSPDGVLKNISAAKSRYSSLKISVSGN